LYESGIATSEIAALIIGFQIRFTRLAQAQHGSCSDPGVAGVRKFAEDESGFPVQPK
jgi:hypothetical protein